MTSGSRLRIVREMASEGADALALAKMKQAARASWAAGDFPAIAQRELWPLGEMIVKRAEIRAGERVLDVACGTGNAAIRAAQAGGRVVGLDLTPELFEAGRRLAAAAGVEVEWVEGDAENLPFADASFDAVLSTIGVMFAPRHRVAAAELVRVLRPGGRMAICSWVADGVLSQILRVISSYLPPAPESASPPWLWGSETHLRTIFEGTGIELEFEHGIAEFPPFESPEADVEYRSEKFGPLVAIRSMLEADGRWPALRAELLPLHEGLVAADYLVALGRKHQRPD